MRLDLFGTLIEVVRSQYGWEIFYLGSDGKRRRARDIVVPKEVSEAELIGYLDDLYHELARPEKPSIRILD